MVWFGYVQIDSHPYILNMHVNDLSSWADLETVIAHTKIETAIKIVDLKTDRVKSAEMHGIVCDIQSFGNGNFCWAVPEVLHQDSVLSKWLVWMLSCSQALGTGSIRTINAIHGQQSDETWSIQESFSYTATFQLWNVLQWGSRD